MATDRDSQTPTHDYEANYSSSDYNVVSRAEREKAQYILKEQMKRSKMLEEENRQYLNMSYPHNRINSLSIQSTATGETEFNDTDWTPPDSSYGAAFPFCGWVPKRIRQGTEKFMIALALFLLVYVIVSIAIRITGDGRSSSYKHDDFSIGDDAFYVADVDDDEEDDFY
mmetsp:Transcript_3794/g.4650  ORF Transcript_3794/g.4650 Transcript_3794/m.4650 type:complete len:169 (-) Transcript_3794:228-734(-)